MDLGTPVVLDTTADVITGWMFVLTSLALGIISWPESRDAPYHLTHNISVE